MADKKEISIKDFLSLISRVEKLEYQLQKLSKSTPEKKLQTATNSKGTSLEGTSLGGTSSEYESDEEEEEKKVQIKIKPRFNASGVGKVNKS